MESTNGKVHNSQVHIFYKEGDEVKNSKLICQEGDPVINLSFQLTSTFPIIVATQEERTYTFYSVVRMEFFEDGKLRETRNYFPLDQSSLISTTL